jgi:hypothetical protein
MQRALRLLYISANRCHGSSSDNQPRTFHIIHPFHPLTGSEFELVTYGHNWGARIDWQPAAIGVRTVVLSPTQRVSYRCLTQRKLSPGFPGRVKSSIEQSGLDVQRSLVRVDRLSATLGQQWPG